MIADHKDEAMKYIDEDNFSIFVYKQKWNPNKERVDRWFKDDKRNQYNPDIQDYEDDEFDFNSKYTLSYGYYYFNILNKYLDKDICKFNKMFQPWGINGLNELVNVLSVEQISKLNDRGYIIGKYFHLEKTYSNKFDP